MILFGLLRSMVGCFFPICYDLFLFFSGFGYGLGPLDFRFFSFFIPFHSLSSFPILPPFLS